MKLELQFVNKLGHVVLSFLKSAGELGLFALETIYHCFTPPFYGKAFLKQFIEIGFYSLPVVALTTLFAGMVIALQTYTGFAQFSAEGAVAMVVLVAVTRELAPVMAGLMVAGRIGAAMAAEIGTMRVTEQIDALSTLSTNPFKYLIVPRIVSGILMLPILVLIGDIIGICGGYMIGVSKLDFNASTYLMSTWEYLKPMDIISGLTKAAVFGFIITLLGCYNGFHSKGGAQGVGQATTNAVVSSSILILIFNYILTELFFSI
ncbi:MAG: ABC transporter permease [Alphaproteobacteria bacterium]|nr:ABC transporter permease [Alphaproteobacteria bacterium]MBQ3116833.1 ABC transporter permease [Alphaproteobacteria bacterium]MBQ6855318.1 ABC transporter permease [Alphaproteobacteria bacterium]MBQ8557600.1 ABC transporter permease [Alphaproteobacteria bacterium]MBR3913135.1 ABC transporter permease [Alphaproteobacteria bacterium]